MISYAQSNRIPFQVENTIDRAREFGKPLDRAPTPLDRNRSTARTGRPNHHESFRPVKRNVDISPLPLMSMTPRG